MTGQVVLIPQGSRLSGAYDSVVAFGQSRALVVWRRIIMPDGASIQIDNLPATDTEGYAGLADGVDYHTWSLLKGVALSTLLGVGTQLSFGNQESDLATAIRQSTQGSLNQAEQQITQKNLAVHARTLELYSQLDLTDAVIDKGHKVPAIGLWVGGKREARLSFEDVGAGVTPYPFLHIFPQDEHEQLLVASAG